jgi:hypothetical protein
MRSVAADAGQDRGPVGLVGVAELVQQRREEGDLVGFVSVDRALGGDGSIVAAGRERRRHQTRLSITGL